MDKIALEIVYHLADLQYEYDCESGQRWPTLLSCQKSHILAFRSVCRAFRDACWLAFRNVLAERIFYLNEEDLAVLSEIVCAARSIMEAMVLILITVHPPTIGSTDQDTHFWKPSLHAEWSSHPGAWSSRTSCTFRTSWRTRRMAASARTFAIKPSLR